MNKLTIPAILVATVMVAGAFAFMPVEQASTVHNSAGGPSKLLALSANMLAGATVAVDAIATWTIGQPFCVMAASITETVDAGDNLDLTDITLATNMEVATSTTLNLHTNTATGTPVFLLEVVDLETPKICGTTTLIMDITGGAGFAASDAVTATVIIETSGTIGTAPAAVLTDS